MKNLLIMLPLVFFVLVSCVSEKRALNPIKPHLSQAEVAGLRSFNLNSDGNAYIDSSGELTLIVTPMYGEEGMVTDTADGIFFDRRVKEISSGYRLTFNKRVKLYSYSVGYSSGRWNEMTTEACLDGVKRPVIFGINNSYGFSADGPWPGSDEPSVNHSVIEAGLFGENFIFNEDQTCEGCYFSIDSIQVLVQ